MADMRIKFLATSVQMQMHLSVFLPERVLRDADALGAARLKTLWLLHGEGGDCSDWSRLSMVEHHAEAAGIALVMPSVDNSMYMDMAHGGYPYFDYLKDDLPRHVRNLVRLLSDRAKDNFVAGVGVGGYGAAKWAMTAPGAFAAAAAIAAPLDIVAHLRRLEADPGGLPDDWAAAFGSSAAVDGTPADLLHLSKTGAPVPLHVYDGGDRSADALRNAGLDTTVHALTGAAGWTSTDAAIAHFIASVVAPGRKGGR